MWAIRATPRVDRPIFTLKSGSAGRMERESIRIRPSRRIAKPAGASRRLASLRPARPEKVISTEAIQRLTDPAYASSLDTRSLDELRAMKAECSDVENALSYLRRLA